MAPDSDDVLRRIEMHLKSLLRLKVEEVLDPEATNKEKVATLHQLGFDNAEMAEIIGTSEGSIRATISDLRSEGVIDE